MSLLFKIISRFETVFPVLFFTVFCIYFIPSFDHEIRIHDTFDGNFSTRHVLVNSGHFFDTDPTAIVPGIMNGLPRGVFPRFTEITSILMFLFGSLNGYALTFFLVRILAAVGMYLFGRDHLKVRDNQRTLLVLISFTFACLPFFIIHGLTVAGIPLMLWAFFNIYKKERVRISYLVFLLFILWSNFVLVGFHLIICLGLIALWFCFKDRKIHYRLFVAIGFIAVLYVLSDYMLFYLHYSGSGYESSRGEFQKFLGLNFNGVLGSSALYFLTGEYTTANYFGYVFLPFIMFFVAAWFKNKKDELFRTGMVFLSLLVFCVVFISLLDWKSFSFFYEKFAFAKIFNFKRFTSLLPGLFFIVVMISIFAANKNGTLIMRLNSIALLLVLFFFLWRGNVSHARSAFDTSGFKVVSNQQITFKEFFDPALYKKVKLEMGADTLNNIINFGPSPSPAKYAGLNVLDDYQGDYPMKYKTEFRKILEGELNKSEKLKKYFDGWGSRCYLSSGKEFENKLEAKYNMLYQDSLAINTSQLKAMNCSYILSSIVIGNASDLNLELKKVLVSDIDFKKMLLYKINL